VEGEAGGVKQLTEGDIAPDFSFNDARANTIKLSQFRGQKNVVVYFYPKDFTPGCNIEAMEFSRDFEKFNKIDVEVIGISPDDNESHQKFKKAMNIPYALAPDTNNKISTRYGVYGQKNIMGRTYLGITRSTFLIDKNGKIIKIFHKVKPLGHTKEVIDAFK
jgi:peroxiredoxin Q/BCP